ncbi:hypothetical protein ABG067_004775 [Albugo candida]
MGRLRSKRKLKQCDPYFKGKREIVGKQQKQYDLAPKDIKKKKKKLTKITREKSSTITNSSQGKKPVNNKSEQLTKIRKDESLRDYSKRINQQVKRVIYEETKRGRRKAQKAKIYFEMKKDKQKQKKNPKEYDLPTHNHAKEMFEGAEFIPFGERVDEPPKLPNPCKKRKQLR